MLKWLVNTPGNYMNWFAGSADEKCLQIHYHYGPSNYWFIMDIDHSTLEPVELRQMLCVHLWNSKCSGEVMEVTSCQFFFSCNYPLKECLFFPKNALEFVQGLK